MQIDNVISVIIPTLNEAQHLPVTLERIRANSAVHEIIVADGGSGDATLQIATAAGAKVVCADRPGRSFQMNAGARVANGEIFLFLHADTQLHNCSLARIQNAMKVERVVGGGFARRFDSDSLFLRCTCVIATVRSSLFGVFLGDQGIFARRNVFEKLGGFKDMNLFEDVDFSRRLARTGKTVTLRPPVLSSARRFAKCGPVLTTCRDCWLTCKYVSGLENHSSR